MFVHTVRQRGGELKPRSAPPITFGMRQRASFCVVVIAATLGASYTAWLGSLGDVFPAGDYPGPACTGCDSAGPPIVALVHGHVSTFFSRQPFMGSVSLVLRAPVVAVVTWLRGDFVIQYRSGTLACFLAVVVLLLPAFALMLRRGQTPFAVLVVIAAIVVGPVTFRAVLWGHPEELLGATFAVAAVIAAAHRRGLSAGVLLGLSIATKQWGVLAALPVLTIAGPQRRQVVAGALAVVAIFVVPMLVGDPTRFIDQNLNTVVAQPSATPFNVWWAFNHTAIDPGTHEPLPVIPAVLREVSHPLAVVLALALSTLYWRRAGGRHPYDALQLLAALFLLRCVLDPLTISYHHAPFFLTIATFEGLRRRGIPVVTLTSTAVILLLEHIITPLSKPDLTNAVYLAWALPTLGYLTRSALFMKPSPSTDRVAVAADVVPAL